MRKQMNKNINKCLKTSLKQLKGMVINTNEYEHYIYIHRKRKIIIISLNTFELTSVCENK